MVCVWHANCQQRHGRILAVQLHSLQVSFGIHVDLTRCMPGPTVFVKYAWHIINLQKSLIWYTVLDRPFCNIKFFNEKITRRINKGRHATVSMLKPHLNCPMAEARCSAVCWLHH